jgi:hypothetical protein
MRSNAIGGAQTARDVAADRRRQQEIVCRSDQRVPEQRRKGKLFTEVEQDALKTPGAHEHRHDRQRDHCAELARPERPECRERGADVDEIEQESEQCQAENELESPMRSPHGAITPR